jgi:hypothetical protein
MAMLHQNSGVFTPATEQRVAAYKARAQSTKFDELLNGVIADEMFGINNIDDALEASRDERALTDLANELLNTEELHRSQAGMRPLTEGERRAVHYAMMPSSGDLATRARERQREQTEEAIARRQEALDNGMTAIPVTFMCYSELDNGEIQYHTGEVMLEAKKAVFPTLRAKVVSDATNQRCLNCRRAYMEAQTDHWEEANEAVLFSIMSGSERQISYARSIRKQAIESFDVIASASPDPEVFEIFAAYRTRALSYAIPRDWCDMSVHMPRKGDTSFDQSLLAVCTIADLFAVEEGLAPLPSIFKA